MTDRPFFDLTDPDLFADGRPTTPTGSCGTRRRCSGTSPRRPPPAARASGASPATRTCPGRPAARSASRRSAAAGVTVAAPSSRTCPHGLGRRRALQHAGRPPPPPRAPPVTPSVSPRRLRQIEAGLADRSWRCSTRRSPRPVRLPGRGRRRAAAAGHRLAPRRPAGGPALPAGLGRRNPRLRRPQPRGDLGRAQEAGAAMSGYCARPPRRSGAARPTTSCRSSRRPLARDPLPGGPLSDLEQQMFFHLLVAAGSETTATPSPRGCWPSWTGPRSGRPCVPTGRCCRVRWRRCSVGPLDGLQPPDGDRRGRTAQA